MKNNQWEMYTRGTIHLHRLGNAFFGVHKFGKKLNVAPITKVLYALKDGKLWWAWDKKEVRVLGNTVLQKLENPKFRKRHFEFIEKLANKAIAVAEKSLQTNFGSLSDEQLSAQYRRLLDHNQPAHGILNPEIDSIDVCFESYFKKKLQARLPSLSPEKIIGLYKHLTVPDHQSYITLQEQTILQTAKNSGADEKTTSLYKKFWWTNLGWENLEPYSRKYFAAAVKKYHNNKAAAKKLAAMKSQFAAIGKKRTMLIKQYRLPADIVYWLKISDEYARLHDLRKEMQVKDIYAQFQFVKEIAKRTKNNPADLEWLWPEEIAGLLTSKKSMAEEIARRKQAAVVLTLPTGIKTLSGDKAKAYMRKNLQKSESQIFEVKGLGVTAGKTRGIAKVCSGYEEALKKVKSGNVLITGMTLPDYFPAMKKAKAIVTDEGGITCHAAIVSRELGKVCVVGTKTATEVFKDGDMVEVDANKGIVKKVS